MASTQVVLSGESLSPAIVDTWPPEQVEAAIELLAANGGKFPHGVRSLPRDLIRAFQRERLIVAMLHAVSELHYESTNVKDVLDRAGVTRPVFYKHFVNKEDCFLLAFDQGADRLRIELQKAARKADESWRERLRAVIEELLQFVAREPHTARVLIVESRAAGPAALARRVALLDGFATRIASLPGKSASPHALQASVTLVGAIETLLYSRLSEDKLDDLDSLVPSLMYLAVVSYEGQAAAVEELAAG